MTKVSIDTISVTLIKLTSISGGRFEPPTVFAVRLVSIVTYLSGFVKYLFDRLTNCARRGIIKITKRRTAVSGSPPWYS